MELKEVLTSLKTNKINNDLPVLKSINNFWIKNDKYKDFSYLKQEILKKKNTSRNLQNILRILKFVKSTKSQFQSKTFPFHIIQKNKTINFTTNSNYFKNKNENSLKRNYSAYYMKGDLYQKKSYISDLLLNDYKFSKNKSQPKILDLEKKISNFSKTFNLSSIIPKSKSLFKSSEIKKIVKIKKNKKEENRNSIPDYLIEELKIKGTNILSPFCKKWRDQYIDKKFNLFFDESNNELKSYKKVIIDNKFNILYAENKNIYQAKLKKINKILKRVGQKEKYKNFFTPSEKQLKDMEKKVTLMKNVMDFAYPSTSYLLLKSYKKKNSFIIKNPKRLNTAKESVHINKTDRDRKKNNIIEIKFNK